jgi:hypothetical protein
MHVRDRNEETPLKVALVSRIIDEMEKHIYHIWALNKKNTRKVEYSRSYESILPNNGKWKRSLHSIF